MLPGAVIGLNKHYLIQKIRFHCLSVIQKAFTQFCHESLRVEFQGSKLGYVKYCYHEDGSDRLFDIFYLTLANVRLARLIIRKLNLIVKIKFI